jgi:hypothetical protein
MRLSLNDFEHDFKHAIPTPAPLPGRGLFVSPFERRLRGVFVSFENIVVLFGFLTTQ